MTVSQADVLEYYLRAQDGVQAVKVYDRTQDAVVLYEAERGSIAMVVYYTKHIIFCRVIKTYNVCINAPSKYTTFAVHS